MNLIVEIQNVTDIVQPDGSHVGVRLSITDDSTKTVVTQIEGVGMDHDWAINQAKELIRANSPQKFVPGTAGKAPYKWQSDGPQYTVKHFIKGGVETPWH